MLASLNKFVFNIGQQKGSEKSAGKPFQPLGNLNRLLSDKQFTIDSALEFR